jgi:hypothetical protein
LGEWNGVGAFGVTHRVWRDGAADKNNRNRLMIEEIKKGRKRSKEKNL